MKQIRTHRISIDSLALFVIASGCLVESLFVDLEIRNSIFRRACDLPRDEITCPCRVTDDDRKSHEESHWATSACIRLERSWSDGDSDAASETRSTGLG